MYSIIYLPKMKILKTVTPEMGQPMSAHVFIEFIKQAGKKR